MNPNLIDSLGWAMAQVYASVTDRLLINLARHFRFIKDGAPIPKSWEYQMQKLAEMGQVTRESEAIILKSLGGADEALQLMLETAIRDGLKTAEPALRKGAEKGLLNGQGFLPPELAPNQMQAFKAFYRQSADKLNLVNTVMLESTQQAYQATLSDIVTRINNTQQILNTASGEVITGVSSFNQALRDGVNKMVENGLTGFIDHGGHHWSPEAYVAMDTRTTVANTARAAVFERMEDYSDDLYVVSWHNGARPLCYPWQLKVISRSDWTGEVEDLDGNKIHVFAQSETSYGEPAGLFGINCKHYPSPFIPGVSTIHGEPQDKEANDKAYAESQEQRRLERNLRQEKRDLEVMKAQGATDEEIKAQRMRVKNASAELNNFCDETGRSRVPWREKAPVDAKFPVPDPEAERTINERELSFLPPKQNKINSDYIESEEYAQRFQGITGNTKTDATLADSAQKILSHRSGTNFEDLYLIDADTGDVIHSLTTSNVRNGIKYDAKTETAIANATKSGKRIIAMHNHPNNYPPSFDDGVSAKSRGYVQGVVVGHDGSIYTYTPTDEIYKESDCDALHEMINQEIWQRMELKNTWFTSLKVFGMIVSERK